MNAYRARCNLIERSCPADTPPHLQSLEKSNE
jgi:hypothetical protein